MTTWHFLDDHGTFRLEQPHHTSYLYFPLVSTGGLVASVTPTLHGDTKLDHHTYLTEPVSVETLHTSRAGRNFWLNIDGYGPWSATGQSARQVAARFAAESDSAESATLTAGFLWHRITRRNPALGLETTLTSVVPPQGDQVELLCVTVRNSGDAPLRFTPTAAVPLYGRSADNLRDHRHVTSLLHHIWTDEHGVLVKPTMTFDEMGHRRNQFTYAVLGAEGDGTPPAGFHPIVETFVGEGGTFDWPEAVVAALPPVPAGFQRDGYEALGGLQFAPAELAPGAERSYVLALVVSREPLDSAALMARYGSAERFAACLAATQSYWRGRLDTFQAHTGDRRFDGWLQWVTLQPILRRLAGNSYLPYHDYGRGGRGWRDLWQDLLALLLMEPDEVRPLLLSNFAGVRLDGSNATIIGSAPGEFKADRNNIPRVWMDHGAWPWLTTRLYIDRSGDLSFMLQEQGYFKDVWTHRARQVDADWSPEDGTVQRTRDGAPYHGTVLEHLLIQHLTAFFNVGEHNIIRLEGADWNDGLDQARERGESVAFTALYAGNLLDISDVLDALAADGVTLVDVAEELLLLLDTLGEQVAYASPAAKQARLLLYCDAVHHAVSGRRVAIPVADLARDLRAKAGWLMRHLRRQEWVTDNAGHGWFNGYYDEDGQRVEGVHGDRVRMTLTGQVFALMAGVATDEQAQRVVDSAETHLYDPTVGGFRLNTDFGAVLLNLGRCFGFAFGHKENGAMFSHMAVMYANALYRRGFVADGWRVLHELYHHCQHFPTSKMYPGLPEYVSDTGRGMYPYLTGSASWYLLTLLGEAFGVNGRLGDLVLRPRLVPDQFDDSGCASITTLFAGRRLHIRYCNPERLPHAAVQVGSAQLNGQPLPGTPGAELVVARGVLEALSAETTHTLDVTLVPVAA